MESAFPQSFFRAFLIRTSRKSIDSLLSFFPFPLPPPRSPELSRDTPVCGVCRLLARSRIGTCFQPRRFFAASQLPTSHATAPASPVEPPVVSRGTSTSGVASRRRATCASAACRLRPSSRVRSLLAASSLGLPEIKPQSPSTNASLCCPAARTTCAACRQGFPAVIGRRLVAFTALLMACFRQSKRRAALFLEQLSTNRAPRMVVKLQNSDGGPAADL